MNEAKAITGTSRARKSDTTSSTSTPSHAISNSKLPTTAQAGRILTIQVNPDDAAVMAQAMASARRAFATGEYQGEKRSFATLPQLFNVFTANRWQLIETLQDLGPSSLRGLARALGRDVKRVHEDVDRLLEEGLIERGEDKRIYIPFEEIRFEASLKIKAA